MNDLNRFIVAHEKNYDIALSEIKNGMKHSHWMWYIFPQFTALGYSSTAKYYGIKNEEEVKEYINNELLRNHLIEISEAIYKLNRNISYILGYPDDLKLKSCMTLFNYIDPSIKVFQQIINKYYNGEKDETTLELLKSNGSVE